MNGDFSNPLVKRATSSKGRRRNSKLIVSSRIKFVVKIFPPVLAASEYALEAAWCNGSLESSRTSHPHVSMKSFTRDSYHRVLHQCFGKVLHRIRFRSPPGTDRGAPVSSSIHQSFAGERHHSSPRPGIGTRIFLRQEPGGRDYAARLCSYKIGELPTW